MRDTNSNFFDQVLGEMIVHGNKSLSQSTFTDRERNNLDELSKALNPSTSCSEVLISSLQALSHLSLTYPLTYKTLYKKFIHGDDNCLLFLSHLILYSDFLFRSEFALYREESCKWPTKCHLFACWYRVLLQWSKLWYITTDIIAN